jgi:hypothetical protein
MKLLISIILVTISSFTSFAQQKTPPPPGAARPLNLPKITEKKLGNGLTVILAPSTKRTEGFSNPHVQSGHNGN